LLLKRVANVLNVSLEELFAAEPGEIRDDGQHQSTQKRTILRFIDQLPTHRLEEAAARLMRDFGPEQNQRHARVALIGLRGAGKSTLGCKLAAERNVLYIELDHEIEKDTGMPLAEIFSLYGQSGYRAIEKRTLERVVRASERAVIAVGGGIVSEKETFDYLLAHCYTIWLKAQPEEHMSRVIAQGDFRAMAGSDRAMEDLRQILDSREPLYRKADAQVDTSQESVEESFTKLKAALAVASR
jgi:XRE family aerobic/anaerobic benzoate catabolism transcriptional regulator